MQKFEISTQLSERIHARRGRLHGYESYNPETTALLVVDMQNYFVAGDEQGFCEAARDIVPNINRLAGTLRGAGGTVVWIQMEASAESRENWRNLLEIYRPEFSDARFQSLGAEGEGYKLWPALEVADGDEMVVKRRYSAFIQGSSDIETVLRRHAVETVLVAGVATNVCCDSTARDCMMRGFRTLMVSDANAGFTEAAHGAALATFLAVFGDVQTTDEVVERLRRKGRGRTAAE